MKTIQTMMVAVAAMMTLGGAASAQAGMLGNIKLVGNTLKHNVTQNAKQLAKAPVQVYKGTKTAAFAVKGAGETVVHKTTSTANKTVANTKAAIKAVKKLPTTVAKLKKLGR